MSKVSLTNGAKATPRCIGYAQRFKTLCLRKNYVHAALLLHESPLSLPSTAVDCGGGSGATTLAYLTAQQLRNSDSPNNPVAVEIVDRNPAQLQLAKRLLLGAAHLFPNLVVDFHFRECDLNNEAPRAVVAGLLLAGHFLTENRGELESLLGRCIALLPPAGHLFVFEDADDPVWLKIDPLMAELARPKCDITTSMETLSRFPETRFPLFANSRTRSLVVSRLRSPLSEYLVDRYFRAWREQSVEALDEIFDTHARYLDLTSPGAISGLDQIRRYWRQHVLLQRNLRLKTSRVFEHGTELVCEWDVSFSSFLHGEAARFVGVLILTIDATKQRVTLLREYFHRIDATVQERIR